MSKSATSITSARSDDGGCVIELLASDNGSTASPLTPADIAFSIDSVDRANWLVRRVNEARAYGERVRTWAAAEELRARRQEQRLLHRYGRQLEAWATEQIASRRRGRKSVSLPAGVIGFRRIGPKIKIENPTAVIAWAKQHLPAAVVTRQHLLKAAIDDHFAQVGEIPSSGARLEPAHERFYIS